MTHWIHFATITLTPAACSIARAFLSMPASVTDDVYLLEAAHDVAGRRLELGTVDQQDQLVGALDQTPFRLRRARYRPASRLVAPDRRSTHEEASAHETMESGRSRSATARCSARETPRRRGSGAVCPCCGSSALTM
jgi:hypothetical protein